MKTAWRASQNQSYRLFNCLIIALDNTFAQDSCRSLSCGVWIDQNIIFVLLRVESLNIIPKPKGTTSQWRLSISFKLFQRWFLIATVISEKTLTHSALSITILNATVFTYNIGPFIVYVGLIVYVIQLYIYKYRMQYKLVWPCWLHKFKTTYVLVFWI